MKKILLVLFLGIFSITACEYNDPLTTEHNIPIDQGILGCWKITSIDNKDNDTEIRIYKFSETEYALQYLEDGGSLYFRAYAINIGGVNAIQLELIGDDEGPVSDDEDDRYHVASYKMMDDLLMISILNSTLVDDEAVDSKSLREAFIKNKDNPELFNDPGVFRRVKN